MLPTISHPATQWLLLCAALGVDPELATACEVMRKARRGQMRPGFVSYLIDVRVGCDVGEVFAGMAEAYKGFSA